MEKRFVHRMEFSRSSTQSNKNNTIKETETLKIAKILSTFEAFCKRGDRNKTTESKQTPFDDYERLEVSAQAMLRSLVEKPPRIRRKSSNTSLLDTRLSKKKGEKLDYSYVFVEETDFEKSTKERLIHEVKNQNWVENETKSHFGSPLLCSDSQPRRENAKMHDFDENFSSESQLRRFNNKPQYRNRFVHMDKGEVSKQFCDVLGVCADCTKSQMQQFVIDENTRNFPEICVSPYVLCVPEESERDIKTLYTIYKACDPLQRRRPSTISLTHNKNGLKTRPNSCNEGNANLHDAGGFPSVGSTSESSERIETPFSSRCSSRRSSITRYLMESKDAVFHVTESGSHAGAKASVSSNPRRVRIFPVPQSPSTEHTNEKTHSVDKLDPNSFNKRKLAARSATRSALKKRSISRTGKLSELPYWRFLIPEPPMMDVARMNVSIYTPKQIPGIKIFDESFFEI